MNVFGYTTRKALENGYDPEKNEERTQYSESDNNNHQPIRRGIIVLIIGILGVLFAAFITIQFFKITFPPYGVKKVTMYSFKENNFLAKQDTFLVNATDKNKTIYFFHTRAVDQNTAKMFVMKKVYTYAQSIGQVLENDIIFIVSFPSATISSKDTLELFTKIRAFALLALQQASNEIGSDFYSITVRQVEDRISYSELFERYLNAKDIRSKDRDLNDIYFSDVSIGKINYNGKSREETMGIILEIKKLLIQIKMLDNFNDPKSKSIKDSLVSVLHQAVL
ncbi:MAG: hypothetical protein HYW78_03880 [Parcubacteria group bacterium]|nr:hypothetical protein [Parcubacteria group bacterium]